MQHLMSQPYTDYLPTELISDIFELFVNSADSNALRQRTRLSITASHLSQRLRAVARSTPSLWTSIDVAGRDLRELEQCLELSGTCGLDILLNAAELSPTDVVAAISHLRRHVPRWASLKVLGEHVDDDEASQVALLALNQSLSSSAAEILHTLEVAALSARSLHQAPLRLDLTKLRSLSLRHVGVAWSSSNLPLLEELSLVGLRGAGAPSAADIARLLRSSSRLRSIHIQDTTIDSSEESESPSEPAPLPNLTALSLQSIPLPSVHHILTLIDSAPITDLTIKVADATTGLDWSLITPTLGHVERFDWQYEMETSEGGVEDARVAAMFDSVAGQMRNASRAVIHSQVGLRRLASSASDPGCYPMLPNLAELECGGMQKHSLVVLQDLVVGRAAAGVKRLERLSISARELSVTASVGQRVLEAQDAMMDSLIGSVDSVEVREGQEGDAFRYTFMGWRDYQNHEQRGRWAEYEQEMEE